LKTSLAGVPVGDVIITRNQTEVLVTVFTAKASLVLGNNDENLATLEATLSKKTGAVVKLTVKEVKKPELNAKVV